jgi:fimbrial chaperone protein
VVTFVRFAAAFAALSLTAASAGAASLEVGPIRVALVGKERTATLTVRNSATTPVKIQVRTADWVQQDGQDQLTPSSALIASPPQFDLGPGATQTVRLVLEGVSQVSAERAWRVIVDELPERRSQQPGVSIPLRLLIPVFLAPAQSAKPALTWSAKREGEKVVVTARNGGVAHERLLDLSFLGSDGQRLGAADGSSGYLLSGASQSWTLGDAKATRLTAKANGALGPLQTDIPVN